MAPWLSAGTWGLGLQRDLLSGDFSSFKESPDYQFRLQQGLQGLERGAAARGRLYSGGQQADLINYNQGMASQAFGDFYNRLAGLSNTGQTTANQLGGYGANYANQIGQNAMAAGNARASAYNQQGAAWGNYANQLGGLTNYAIQNYRGGGG